MKSFVLSFILATVVVGHGTGGRSSSDVIPALNRRRVQMFARSMKEIESLRQAQAERLLKAMKIDEFPEDVNIYDPKVMALLSPKVRAVCEAFPHQAEEVVRKHGLSSHDFNQMLKETKGNPFFRWRVEKFMSSNEADHMDEETRGNPFFRRTGKKVSLSGK